MKKNDWYIAAAVMIIAFSWWGIQHFFISETGMEITVTQAGKTIGIYNLQEDNRLIFTGTDGSGNVLVIKDGMAYMSEADCPDRLCVKQRAISKKGESIICLPHRLVAEVTSGKAPDVDAVAR